MSLIDIFSASTFASSEGYSACKSFTACTLSSRLTFSSFNTLLSLSEALNSALMFAIAVFCTSLCSFCSAVVAPIASVSFSQLATSKPIAPKSTPIPVTINALLAVVAPLNALIAFAPNCFTEFPNALNDGTAWRIPSNPSEIAKAL